MAKQPKTNPMPFPFQDNLGVEDDGCDLGLQGPAVQSQPPVRGGVILAAKGDRGGTGSLRGGSHRCEFMASEKIHRQSRRKPGLRAREEGRGGAFLRRGSPAAPVPERFSGEAASTVFIIAFRPHEYSHAAIKCCCFHGLLWPRSPGCRSPGRACVV